MGLRFFADHCVSNAIMQTLREGGHEVMRLREHLPVESLDTVVIAQAQHLDAILLSLNGDFADIVTYSPADYQGIIAGSYWWSKSTEFGCGNNGGAHLTLMRPLFVKGQTTPIGFAEAGRAKKESLTEGLTGERPVVKAFAEKHIAELNLRIASDQRCAEAEREMRNRSYDQGDETDDDAGNEGER